MALDFICRGTPNSCPKSSILSPAYQKHVAKHSLATLSLPNRSRGLAVPGRAITFPHSHVDAVALCWTSKKPDLCSPFPSKMQRCLTRLRSLGLQSNQFLSASTPRCLLHAPPLIRQTLTSAPSKSLMSLSILPQHKASSLYRLPPVAPLSFPSVASVSWLLF